MKTFFITLSSSQVQTHWPGRTTLWGGGCVKVTALNEDSAVNLMCEHFGKKWAFIYRDLDKVHELDREVLMTLTQAVKISFTGTRGALAKPQYLALDKEITEAKDTCSEWRHGGCTGADTEFHDLLAEHKQLHKLWVHPSDLGPEYKGKLTGTFRSIDPRPPLERNGDLAKACDRLIACPNTFEEIHRSGTWATIRYARAFKRVITIIWPDGKVEEEG